MLRWGGGRVLGRNQREGALLFSNLSLNPLLLSEFVNTEMKEYYSIT